MVSNKRRKVEDETIPRDVLNEIAEQLADLIQGRPLKAEKYLEELMNYIEDLRDAIGVVINMIRNRLAGAEPNSSEDEVISTLQRVLAHSHRLSFTTSAPPGYSPGRSFLHLSKPPAPQPPQLQSSILHNIGREYEEKRKRETDAHVGYIPEATVDQQPSERLEVTKPLSIPQGIDTELLKKLPPMPKGWKPGDPIPGLPKQQESKEVKQTKKAPPAPFSFALNPDMDIEFGVGESEESDSDDNE
eukprot:jgi/Picsp_1/1158/NSC_04639-R1_---NA---